MPKLLKSQIRYKQPLGERKVLTLEGYLIQGTDFGFHHKPSNGEPRNGETPRWMIIHIPSQSSCGASKTKTLALARAMKFQEIFTLHKLLGKADPWKGLSKAKAKEIKAECSYFQSFWEPGGPDYLTWKKGLTS